MLTMYPVRTQTFLSPSSLSVGSRIVSKRNEKNHPRISLQDSLSVSIGSSNFDPLLVKCKD